MNYLIVYIPVETFTSITVGPFLYPMAFKCPTLHTTNIVYIILLTNMYDTVHAFLMYILFHCVRVSPVVCYRYVPGMRVCW